MPLKSLGAIEIRQEATDKVSVVFPEDISKDVAAIQDKSGTIPVEYMVAVLSRAALAKGASLQAGCERCGKDCFW